MSIDPNLFKLGLMGVGALLCAGWPTLAQAELNETVIADPNAIAEPTASVEGDGAAAWHLAFSPTETVSLVDGSTAVVLATETLAPLPLDRPNADLLASDAVGDALGRDSFSAESSSPERVTVESIHADSPRAENFGVESINTENPSPERVTVDSPGVDYLAADAVVETANGVAQDLQPTLSGLLAADSAPAATSAAANQMAQVRPSNDTPGWEMVLSPYLFVPFNVRSDITVGGFTESVSAGLGDIFNLDRVLAGALRFEARHPRYGFFADAAYISVRETRSAVGFPLPPQIAGILSAQTGLPIPPGTPTDAGITATGRTTTISLGGYYRVVDQVLGGPSNTAYPRLLVDPYAGIRLVALNGSANVNVALGGAAQSARVSDSTVLVKPMVGAQVGLELSPQWALGLRGDISGLAIGADESFAWGLWAGARYRFSPGWAVQLGYQYKDARYRIGNGATQFGIDQTQNGMWLGLDISL